MKRVTGYSVRPPLPPAVSVELSSRCNLACPECVNGAGLLQRKSEFISYSLAQKIATELRGHTISAWLSFQGEPMMHPRFFELAELFGDMNPVISTNGHFLGEEACHRLASSRLTKIIISYDGVTPETYAIYRRGGDHASVTEGVRRLTAAVRDRGSALKIELQFLIHRGNEHEASAAAEFASSLGVGFRIKSMQVLDSGRAGEWMPAGIGSPKQIMSGSKLESQAGMKAPQTKSGSNLELSVQGKSRYNMSDGDWKPSPTPSRGCLRMWTTAVITTDGDVVPCCYDKNAHHVMGNLNSKTLSEIWYSKQYRSFRDSVMKSRSLADICRNCPQGNRIFFKR
ncbi:MAG: radical SAM/SPASM domain-containing protein [Bacteroidales bacterium]